MKKYALRLLAPLFALFLLLPAIPKGYATTSFVASVNSDVYHVSSCFYVDRIKESNRIWFTSAEEAEASGRRGCSHCQPEQYKSSPSQESQEDPAQSPQEQSQPNSSVQSTQQETPSTSAYVNSEEDTLQEEYQRVGIRNISRSIEKSAYNSENRPRARSLWAIFVQKFCYVIFCVAKS